MEEMELGVMEIQQKGREITKILNGCELFWTGVNILKRECGSLSLAKVVIALNVSEVYKQKLIETGDNAVGE